MVRAVLFYFPFLFCIVILPLSLFADFIPPSRPGVVESCVSIVGADINTASHALLQRIAGPSTV
jgi:hypothetical protein